MGQFNRLSIQSCRQEGWNSCSQGVIISTTKLSFSRFPQAAISLYSFLFLAFFSTSSSSSYSYYCSSLSGSFMSGFYFNGRVQMEHVSFSLSSIFSIFLQQLKQSGMSSLGMMNLEPKYLCRVIKPSKIMLIPMKTISIFTLFGSLVNASRQYLQQIKGTLVKIIVKTSVIAIPPLPPSEYAQLICIASSTKPSYIQKTRFLWKTQTRLKYTTKKIIKSTPFFLLLNSLKITLQYFLRKKRLNAMLIRAQMATIFRFVSSFLKAQLRKIMFVETMKAATWTIIHQERLQTDFFALKKITATAKRNVQPPTNSTKVLYQLTTGLKKALKLKEVDSNLISIFVALSMS